MHRDSSTPNHPQSDVENKADQQGAPVFQERRKAPRITRQNRAYDDSCYPWNIAMVPPTLVVGAEEIPHPALHSAIFVVHGIGEHEPSSTSSSLRSGFEDTLLAIRAWQKKHPELVTGTLNPVTMPPPFVHEGFWSNYADLEQTFPDEWELLNPSGRKFFTKLWRQRTHSIPRLFRWFIRQQLRLLHPRVFKEVGLFRWLLYLPLQVIVPITLVLATLRFRRLFTGFLSDVRLYLDPKGVVERAIVQRIDYRVGEKFLEMLGLDWHFLPLPLDKRLQALDQPVQFKRVVWVAHSLGTVISFNVLSDLLHRAAAIRGSEPTSDMTPEQRERLALQKKGVQQFRLTLEHFITLGSPLEKAAFLFQGSLRPWPSASGDGAERFEWVNFYHVLDPVSGRLWHERLVPGRKPYNYHVRAGWVPGLAHIAYWNDKSTLRFVLSRMYGKRVLRDRDYVEFNPFVQRLFTVVAYFVWAALLLGSAYFAAIKSWPLLRAAARYAWSFLRI